MTNPFNQLRMRNLMGMNRQSPEAIDRQPDFQHPQTLRQRALYAEPAPEPEGMDYLDEYDRLRGDMPVTSAYRQHLLQGAPTREEHRPSIWNRIAAGLAGGSAGFRNPGEGVRTAMEVNEAPWRSAYQDYSSQAETMRRGSDLEQEDFDTKARMLAQARALGIRVADLRQRAEYQGRMAGAAESRAQASLINANNPDWEKIDKPGGVELFNRKNPSERQFIPGETVASLRAKATSRFASAAERNASTNVRRANDYGRLVDSTISQRQHDAQMDLERLSLDQQKYSMWSPDDQLKAMDLALRELMNHPMYGEFVRPANETDQFYGIQEDAPPMFMDAVEDMMEDILSRRRPGVR